MEKAINSFLIFSVLALFLGCEQAGKKDQSLMDGKNIKPELSVAEIKADLLEKGYEIFDYVDPQTADTVIMQQYFIAFLKKGPNRSQNKKQADSLQTLHLEHLGRMYELGFADISGPFGDDGDIRGITIYNTPTLEIADSLANLDPMVKSGRLVIEMHPWWAAKGFPLR
ncbi:YciI family protein [Muriicola sp. E247]|uniref:YciI family protein n=1 Tax=Muriicola sp. E247 TaxID=3242730 RepID=UPI00352571D1